VAVGVHRDGDGGVAEPFADHLGCDARSQGGARVAVAHVVEPDLRQSGPSDVLLEPVREQMGWIGEPSGCVKTSPADAAYHALTGTVPRSELRRVGLLSDGATRLVDRFGTMAWPHLLDVLDREGPYALIVQTREAENGDPEGRRWPRSKRHDDASAVLCRFRCDS
jgi:hypothetical protein